MRVSSNSVKTSSPMSNCCVSGMT